MIHELMIHLSCVCVCVFHLRVLLEWSWPLLLMQGYMHFKVMLTDTINTAPFEVIFASKTLHWKTLHVTDTLETWHDRMPEQHVLVVKWRNVRIPLSSNCTELHSVRACQHLTPLITSCKLACCCLCALDLQVSLVCHRSPCIAMHRLRIFVVPFIHFRTSCVLCTRRIMVFSTFGTFYHLAVSYFPF